MPSLPQEHLQAQQQQQVAALPPPSSEPTLGSGQFAGFAGALHPAQQQQQQQQQLVGMSCVRHGGVAQTATVPSIGGLPMQGSCSGQLGSWLPSPAGAFPTGSITAGPAVGYMPGAAGAGGAGLGCTDSVQSGVSQPEAQTAATSAAASVGAGGAGAKDATEQKKQSVWKKLQLLGNLKALKQLRRQPSSTMGGSSELRVEPNNMGSVRQGAPVRGPETAVAQQSQHQQQQLQQQMLMGQGTAAGQMGGHGGMELLSLLPRLQQAAQQQQRSLGLPQAPAAPYTSSGWAGVGERGAMHAQQMLQNGTSMNMGAGGVAGVSDAAALQQQQMQLMEQQLQHQFQQQLAAAAASPVGQMQLSYNHYQQQQALQRQVFTAPLQPHGRPLAGGSSKSQQQQQQQQGLSNRQSHITPGMSSLELAKQYAPGMWGLVDMSGIGTPWFMAIAHVQSGCFTSVFRQLA